MIPKADAAEPRTARVAVLQPPGTPNESAQDLAAALQRGDKQAQFAAWHRYSRLAHRTLLRFLGPGHEVQDLVQEVFFRFFRSVGRLRERDSLSAFLIGICYNVALEELRRRKLRAWLRLTPTGQLPEPTVTADNPEAAVVEQLYACLLQVSAEDRALFVLRYVEQLNLEELSQALSMSVPTTRRRLQLAKKRIDALLRREPLLRGYVGDE